MLWVKTDLYILLEIILANEPVIIKRGLQIVEANPQEALDPFHVPYGRHYRSDVLSVVGARIDMISYVFGGFSIFRRVMGGQDSSYNVDQRVPEIITGMESYQEKTSTFESGVIVCNNDNDSNLNLYRFNLCQTVR
nr:hypothetical protein [Tanacetum cinerariifolium]